MKGLRPFEWHGAFCRPKRHTYKSVHVQNISHCLKPDEEKRGEGEEGTESSGSGREMGCDVRGM